MATIKIISDPYNKSISFQELNLEGEWVELQDSPSWTNSGLLASDLRSGFFPFSAERIINCILTEDGIENNVVFEGPSDEYDDLVSLCEDEAFIGKVNLTKSSASLPNARDILPQIIRVFEDALPIIDDSIKENAEINNDILKFREAADEVVPVCVLGNYSAGKSSFINALIGSEVLPNGGKPVTAKVYRISNSDNSGTACISFTWSGKKYSVTIADEGFELSDSSNQVLNEVAERLVEVQARPLADRVREILEMLNEYGRDNNSDRVGDLIELIVPFGRGIVSESHNNYVIFDTPGSNSATNKKHAEVLKNAMKNMSNGLPIFVATHENLDTTDNEKLEKELIELDELDSRFTMIVVNKADTADLPQGSFSAREEREFLEQAVPSKLYRDGIYFVSSIMGLGAKIDGAFSDYHSGEVYETKKNMYTDESSRFYKQLYKYNITSSQLKKRAVCEAETSDNIVLANSGLMSIESEIDTFADKYAAYNKCVQAKMFLQNVIDSTEREIMNQSNHLKNQRDEKVKLLKEKESKIISDVTYEYELFMREMPSRYRKYLHGQLAPLYRNTDLSFIKQDDFIYTAEEEDRLGYSKKLENLSGAGKTFVDDFFNLVAYKGKDTGIKVKDDVIEIARGLKDVTVTKISANEAASDRLLESVIRKFSEDCDQCESAIMNASTRELSNQSIELRNSLRTIISGSSDLDEVRKKELDSIIIGFEELTFDNRASDLFQKKDFINRLEMNYSRIGKLKQEKIKRVYEREHSAYLNRVHNVITSSHQNSLRIWAAKLYDILTENMIEFSPELLELQREIDATALRIEELNENLYKLNEYNWTVEGLVNWKSE